MNAALAGIVLALAGLTANSDTRDSIDSIAALQTDLQNGLYVFQLCADCHTPQGWGAIDGSVPMLAGQHPRVLIKQLLDIRDGHRGNDAMFSFAQDSVVGGNQAIADAVDYISRLPMASSRGIGPGRGLATAADLYAARCASCHGVVGEGDDARLYPRIQGQHYGYLQRQMERIVAGSRANADPAMVDVLRDLSAAQRDALADFIARLQPDPSMLAPPGWENPDFNTGFQ